MKRVSIVVTAVLWLAMAPVVYGAWVHFHSGNTTDIGVSPCDIAWQHGYTNTWQGHGWVTEQAQSCTNVQVKMDWLYQGAWVRHYGPVDPQVSQLNKSNITGLDRQITCGNGWCEVRY